jgi:hypothetical protein
VKNDNKTVDAIFTQNAYNLTMRDVGQGSVLPINGTYPFGASVNIKSIDVAGWLFASWGGNAG